MREEIIYEVRYSVSSFDLRSGAREFDSPDEAIRHAAQLLKEGTYGVTISRYETRKSALEREAVSPASETGS